MNPPKAAHPTATATQLSLTRLAGGLTAVGLLWLAAWIVLAPPENVAGPWLRFAVISAALAIPAAVAALLPHLPGARWIPLATSLMAFVALITVNVTVGLLGWWPTMELATLLALTGTVALPTLAASAAQLAILVLAGWVMLRGASSDAVAAGPAASISAFARLLVAAGTVLIGNALLRRASAATDALVAKESHQREVLEVEERRRRTDRDARRFLHDSGMNSLEAVSRGVPPSSVQALRERCADDAERWLRVAAGPDDDAASAFEPAFQEAALRGLTVDHRFIIDGRLPTDVLHALAQATGEALRNCAKHAQVTTVTVDVRVMQGSARVVVVDTGRGFDPAVPVPGLGVENSIRRRMVDAGGVADIDSSIGHGTRVQLDWPVAPDFASDSPGSSAGALDLPQMLARLAWLPIAAVALGAVASTIVNWWSVQAPWLLGASGLLLAGVSGWLVHRSRSHPLDAYDITVFTCALVLSTLIMPAADPFCSAASGPAVIPDGRLVALALIGVLLASWRVTVAVLVAVLCALAGAALMWLSLWPMCAPATIPTAIGLTLVAVAGLAFGRAVRSQELAAWTAFNAMEATNLELARRRADELVRAEWGIAAVAEVRDLLRTVSDPATDLRDPALRRAAADAAARLRTVVQASELPALLATVVAKLADVGRKHNFPVTVEGDLGQSTLDASTDLGTDSALRHVATELELWLEHNCDRATSAAVTLSDFGGMRSVLVCLVGAEPWVAEPSAGGETGVVLSAAASEVITIDSWIDQESRWWQAEWVRSVSPVDIMN